MPDLKITLHKFPEVDREKISRIMGYPCLGIDIETTGLDPYKDSVVMIQIANDQNDEVDVFDLRHGGAQFLFDMLNEYPGVIYFHNAAFDLRFLYSRHRSLLYCNLFDTYLAELVIAGGRNFGFGLDDVVERRLGIKMDKSIRDEFILPMFNIMSVSDVQARYAALDAWVLPRIGKMQSADLKASGQEKIASLEFNVVKSVVKAMLRGFLLDVDAWNQIYVEAQTTAETKRKELEFIVNIPFFNPNSEASVIKAMNKLGLEVPEVKGKKTTREEFISKIKHPFVTTLLEYRAASKAASTYGKEFLNNIHPLTGRIHTDYRQIGADTGRFSSSKPNLQNIPKDSKFRRCFIAPHGYSLISADFSSQEIMVMAEVSRDKNLLKVFELGLDRHTAAAADIFKVPYDQVTPEQRRQAKVLNFALAYGSSAQNIANKLNLAPAHAEKLVNDYWATYKDLYNWQRRAGLQAWIQKYSTTLLGRRRYYDDQYEKHQVLRMGANHVIQGTSADMTKQAIINVEKAFRDSPNVCMINFIHDEIVTEVPDDVAEECAATIRRCMEDAGAEFVKVTKQKSDVKIAKYWA